MSADYNSASPPLSIRIVDGCFVIFNEHQQAAIASKPVETVAYHEAGHAVVGALVGVAAESADILPFIECASESRYDAKLGQVRWSALSFLGFAVERYMLDLAGPLTEVERYGFMGSDCSKEVSASSIALRNRLPALFRPFIIPLASLLRLRTRRLIRKHWPAITAVAAALVEKRALAGYEITDIIAAA